jgi:hypothetical protein
VAGYAAAGLALIGLLALSPTSPTAGLGQRLLEFAVLAWVVCCGRYLARREGHGAGRPAPPGPRHPGASA